MRPALGERLALAAAAVVLVLAGVFVAVGGPAKDSTEPIEVPTTTPLLSVPSNAPTITSAPTPAARATPPIKPVATSGVQPGKPTQPIAGKYVYDETDSGGESTSTLLITDNGGGRQTEQNSSGTIDNVQWTAAGKNDLQTTFHFVQGTVKCPWSPVLIDYRFPLHAGASWTERASCHPRAGDSIAVDAVAHVARSERLVVAGGPVDVWVVVVDGTLKLDIAGTSTTQKIHDEDHFSPDHGITVEEILDSVTTDASGTQTRDRLTRVVQNVAPGTSA